MSDVVRLVRRLLHTGRDMDLGLEKSSSSKIWEQCSHSGQVIWFQFEFLIGSCAFLPSLNFQAATVTESRMVRPGRPLKEGPDAFNCFHILIFDNFDIFIPKISSLFQLGA